MTALDALVWAGTIAFAAAFAELHDRRHQSLAGFQKGGMKRYLWPLACVLCLALGYALAHLPALRYSYDTVGSGRFEKMVRTDRTTGKTCQLNAGTVTYWQCSNN